MRIFTSSRTNVTHVDLHTRMLGSFTADTDSDENVSSSTIQSTYTQDSQYTSTLSYWCCIVQHLQSVQLDSKAFLHTYPHTCLRHIQCVEGIPLICRQACRTQLFLHSCLVSLTCSAYRHTMCPQSSHSTLRLNLWLGLPS
jgi:hypothetical protein